MKSESQKKESAPTNNNQKSEPTGIAEIHREEKKSKSSSHVKGGEDNPPDEIRD